MINLPPRHMSEHSSILHAWGLWYRSTKMRHVHKGDIGHVYRPSPDQIGDEARLNYPSTTSMQVIRRHCWQKERVQCQRGAHWLTAPSISGSILRRSRTNSNSHAGCVTVFAVMALVDKYDRNRPGELALRSTSLPTLTRFMNMQLLEHVQNTRDSKRRSLPAERHSRHLAAIFSDLTRQQLVNCK